jgi:probable F420-dependent oxidoreductase
VKFDARLEVSTSGIGEEAARLESCGYSGLWTSEAGHDPFIGAALAAASTSGADIGTGVAVALARSPMTVAHSGWDLQALSTGRAVIGLGSQTRAHIERRYGMTWNRPAARMREFVEALEAIWVAWQTESRLDFQGEFYRHTLMAPLFAPEASELEGLGLPRVYLGGVGPRMTEVAGEVASGFICGFTSDRYLREVTVPALARGRQRSGRSGERCEVVCQALGRVTHSDEELEIARRAVREQLGFFAATTEYKSVLAAHGWEDLHGDLLKLWAQGRASEGGQLINDDMVDTFAVFGSPQRVVTEVMRRFDGLADRVILNPPSTGHEEWQELLRVSSATSVGGVEQR